MGIMVAALALHCRTAPYEHRYQNVCEMVLASFGILAVLIACAFYPYTNALGSVSMGLIEATIVAMLVGPACILFIWLVVSCECRTTRIPDTSQPLLRSGAQDVEGSSVALRRSLNSVAVPLGVPSVAP